MYLRHVTSSTQCLTELDSHDLMMVSLVILIYASCLNIVSNIVKALHGLSSYEDHRHSF